MVATLLRWVDSELGSLIGYKSRHGLGWLAATTGFILFVFAWHFGIRNPGQLGRVVCSMRGTGVLDDVLLGCTLMGTGLEFFISCVECFWLESRGRPPVATRPWFVVAVFCVLVGVALVLGALFRVLHVPF